MIDVESQIFSEVAEALRAQFPDVFVTGEYVNAPPAFPCVSLVEMENRVMGRSQTSQSRENHAELMYEVNVYSNKARGRKAEAKAIAGLVDESLAGLNFTRDLLAPVPNEADASIYRMLGRYRAIVSKEEVLFRR